MQNNTERNFNRRYAKEYGWQRSLFYWFFLRIVVDNFMRIFYDYKVYGRENVPKDNGRYIYAGNHVSIFDPPILPFATRKIIAFMAKEELFRPEEKLQWLVKRLGAFAVNRTKPEIATFKTVKDIFTTSWSLGVFPQGGTRPYGKLEGIKKGFAVIAKAAKADIVPVAIAEFSGYPKLKPFTRRKFRVYIGKPISHTLGEEEIIYEWSKFICDHADYENCTPIPESYKEKEPVNV